MPELTDERRKAIAYLHLVLVEGDFWPDDVRTLKRAIEILERRAR